MTRVAFLLGLVACGKVTASQPDATTGDDAPEPDARTGALTVQVSTVGNDLNDGITQPVKTLKRGIGLALANGAVSKIEVAPGRYDAANGETFPYIVPGGITIEGPAGGGAILAGSGTEPGLTLDTGTIANLEFESFALPVTVTSTAHITGARVRSSPVAIRAETTAHLTIDTLDITGPAAGCKTGIELVGSASLVATGLTTRSLATTISAKDQSTVTISGSMLGGDGSCTNTGVITFLSPMPLSIDSTFITGGFYGILMGVDSTSTTPVTLTNTVIRNVQFDALGGAGVVFTMTGGALADNARGGMESGSGTWTFTDVTFSGNGVFGIYLQGTAGNTIGALKMRGCTITQNRGDGIYLFDNAAADLGTTADPGGNTLTNNAGIGLDIDGNFGARLITAVGNTWNANVEGADAQGHYTVGTVTGPDTNVTGSNFSVNASWSLQR
jgi:hypothetical protein